MSQKHHFVLVHAACHGAWVWYKIKPMLESAGHKVTAMDLIACATDTRSFEQIGSVDEYSEPLLKVMESIPNGEKVVLVGESYGGINITIAADKYPEKIAVAVYVNAFMPDTQHKPSFVVDKLLEYVEDWKDSTFADYHVDEKKIQSVILGLELLKTNIYQKSPVEDYELAKMLTRKGSLFRDDLGNRNWFTKEGYGSVKRAYIYGDEDLILAKEFQLWQIENFKPDKVYSVAGGDHKLMFSKPRQLLSCLEDIAAVYA